MKKDDPAYWMLKDSFRSTPKVYSSTCYICRDPEFAQMGLPLCRPCSKCSPGHVPADCTICTECGHDEYEDMESEG